MNNFYHFLAADGFKLAFIAFAVVMRVLRWQTRRAAQNRPKMPPQSAPSAPPIGSSQTAFPKTAPPQSAPLQTTPLRNAPSQNATRPLGNSSKKKDDASPWGNTDPFNSK